MEKEKSTEKTTSELRCPMCDTVMHANSPSPFCSWCGFDVLSYYAWRLKSKELSFAKVLQPSIGSPQTEE